MDAGWLEGRTVPMIKPFPLSFTLTVFNCFCDTGHRTGHNSTLAAGRPLDSPSRVHFSAGGRKRDELQPHLCNGACSHSFGACSHS